MSTNISILITGGDVSARIAAVEKLISGKNIAAYDIVRFAPKEESESFKIGDVRELQQLLSGEPVGSEVRLGVIIELGRATIEAQHALLKLLEEPPVHAAIIATVDRPTRLLSTIQSRCHIIRISDDGFHLSPEETITYQRQLETIFTGETGNRLELAATVAKDKMTAIDWLKGSITILRTSIIQSAIKNQQSSTSPHRQRSVAGAVINHQSVPQSRITLRVTIVKLSRALRTLETSNINPRLLVENLLLDL
ncbi:MAG TPA: hypothetical protein VJL83_02200 [Patescibacteria group bacterium]|nr:hypothetical protein [Patescibacteria group bacterium]